MRWSYDLMILWSYALISVSCFRTWINHFNGNWFKHFSCRGAFYRTSSFVQSCEKPLVLDYTSVSRTFHDSRKYPTDISPRNKTEAATQPVKQVCPVLKLGGLVRGLVCNPTWVTMHLLDNMLQRDPAGDVRIFRLHLTVELMSGDLGSLQVCHSSFNVPRRNWSQSVLDPYLVMLVRSFIRDPPSLHLPAEESWGTGNGDESVCHHRNTPVCGTSLHCATSGVLANRVHHTET